jgi:hypothetical protein
LDYQHQAIIGGSSKTKHKCNTDEYVLIIGANINLSGNIFRGTIMPPPPPQPPPPPITTTIYAVI